MKINPSDKLSDRAAAYWDNAASTPNTHAAIWLANPRIQARVNELVSGSPDTDPFKWFVDWLKDHNVSLPVNRLLCIGCGQGYLERGLMQYDLAKFTTGSDISAISIEVAQQLAIDGGYSSINYTVSDMNVDPISETYDLIMANMSVHHIENLELLFSSAQEVLKKSSQAGYFFMNEFIGPNRFQWGRNQVEIINRLQKVLPKQRTLLSNNSLKAPVRTALNAEMIKADPSESVRSYEILPVFLQYFDICEYRPYRGGILHMLLSDIANNFVDEQDGFALVDLLAVIEDMLTETKIIEDNFAVIVGKPK